MEERIPDEPLVFGDSFCPLCSGKRTHFTCAKCIKAGLFYNSRKRSEESYEEKRQRLETIKKLKSNYADRVLKSTAITEPVDLLRHNIQQCRSKLTVLCEAVSLLKKEQAKDKVFLKKTTEENIKRRSRLEKLKEKIKTHGKESSTCKNEIDKKQVNLTSEMENLAVVRRICIDQVQKCLFPISKQQVFPEIGTPPDNTVPEVSDVVVEAGESCEVALTEATRTSYIEGRWVSGGDVGNIQYQILETLLPANGNYSAYSHWLKANKNGSSESVPTSNLRNSAFGLAAGLSYTCQLLQLMAYFLDITLPQDVSYSEFCLRELSSSEFKSAVSRLNANVMYLCLSQNVDARMLHPKRTLQNIYACLLSTNTHLGRYGPHNVFDIVLPPSEDGDDDDEASSSEDEDEVAPNIEMSSSDTEWETVTMDNQIPTFIPHKVVQSETVRRSSTETEEHPRRTATSSLVSSVTSLWPWKS